jgi:hypothetical protein
MKLLFALAPLSLILSAASLSAATVAAWNESTQGDIPTTLGVLGVGTHTIMGAVGQGGGTGELIDNDWVQFEVPPGTLLYNFTVRTVSGDSYIYFGLDRGAVVGADTVEFILRDSGEPSIDLLGFDSAPGPQPAMTHLFSVGPGGSTALHQYSISIVITPVPEPSVAAVAAGGLVLSFLGSRRRQMARFRILPV